MPSDSCRMEKKKSQSKERETTHSIVQKKEVVEETPDKDRIPKEERTKSKRSRRRSSTNLKLNSKLIPLLQRNKRSSNTLRQRERNIMLAEARSHSSSEFPKAAHLKVQQLVLYKLLLIPLFQLKN